MLDAKIKVILTRAALLSWLILGIGLVGCGVIVAEESELSEHPPDSLFRPTAVEVTPVLPGQATADIQRYIPAFGYATNGQPMLDRTGTLWAPYLEWNIENPNYSGNPYDLIATVTFTHQRSSEMRQTQMYYDGSDTWKFRFTATRTGIWSFTTSSSDADLDGHTGTITIYSNPDPAVKGFLLPAGNKFARQVGESGELEAFLFNVYQDNLAFPADYRDWQSGQTLDYIGTYPAEAWATAYLQMAREHGADVLFIALANQWLQAGALSYEEHSSQNPDPLTFEMLERVISTAHEQGGHLHIWLWGDEQRKWTPIGLPGGIGGAADRRLQRYIAARLGPLPGWSMSYGFDLHEWVTTGQVEAWGSYTHQHLGWPHLLTARTERSFVTPDNLDVYSIDARPTANFYNVAINSLNNAGSRPVLFERRFYHGRDNVWTMEATRRAIWQFTLAGGVGSLWGVHHSLGRGPYPNPEQLSTHRQFWQGRFLLDMVPANELTDGYAMTNDLCYVFYKEDATSILMKLSNMVGPQTAVAIDTKMAYTEIDLGTLLPANQIWHAPYRSDWAIAVGSFRQPGMFNVTNRLRLQPAEAHSQYLPLIVRYLAPDCGN
jgi:hypothetical protein